MKKSIVSFLLLAVGISMSATSFAQSNYTATDKGKFYVTAGVGAYPAYWNEKMPKSHIERLFVEPSINYSLSIKYFLSKNFALSVGGSYYKVSTEFNHSYYGLPVGNYNPNGYVLEWYTSTTGYKYKTLQVFVEGNWVYYRMHKKSGVWYGGMGVCVTHTTGYIFEPGTYHSQDYGWDIDENRVKPGITLLGIRGGRKIGWYAEAGYGYKGILNAGVSVRL